MAITLITGLPGHGKSLRAMWEARRLQLESRPVYQVGIDDCDPTFAQALPFAIEEWMKLPERSVLIVDEAHKHFPQRMAGRPPKWIEDLAEIRHVGIELILVTQDPKALDVFVRRRVGRHLHVSRKMGMQAAIVHEWDHVEDRPLDHFATEKSVKAVWPYPKDLYAKYKSATLHQVKRSVPWKVIGAVVATIIAVVSVGAAARVFVDFDDAVGPEDAKAVAPVKAGAPAGLLPVPKPSVNEPMTPEEYLTAITPRFEGMPWSAPIFDGAKPTELPRVACIIAGAKCQCYTEQATRVRMKFDTCSTIARFGIYRPGFEPAALR